MLLRVLDAPKAPMAQARLLYRRGAGSSRGFALVTVIWNLGLISLLGTAVVVGVHYRTRTTQSISAVEHAAAAAESAINLAIIRVTEAPVQQQASAFPLECRMPGGER